MDEKKFRKNMANEIMEVQDLQKKTFQYNQK